MLSITGLICSLSPNLTKLACRSYLPLANVPENPANAFLEGVFINVGLLKLTLDLCLNITGWSSTSVLSWNGLSFLMVYLT